jgi:uncharacterized protein (TIGR02271 family)
MLSRDQTDRLAGGTVYGPGGEPLGAVARVFLDDRTGTPEWVTLGTATGETFVPLAQAQPHADGVTVPYDRAILAGAPPVRAEAGHLSEQEEAELYRYYGLTAGGAGGPVTGQAPGEGMIRSEERLRVGTRTVVAARARVRKYVVTEMQQVEVPVRREEFRLEWEPVGELDPGDAVVGDVAGRERELVLLAERPVVTMQTVPVERVRVRIETVTETETVAAPVRKEQIEFRGPS